MLQKVDKPGSSSGSGPRVDVMMLSKTQTLDKNKELKRTAFKPSQLYFFNGTLDFRFQSIFQKLRNDDI